MRIGSLNCRGLGNGPTIRGLLDFQKKEDPDILFLSETKMEEKRIDWLRWKIGMPHMIVKNPVGQSGGLTLFWKREVNLRVVGFMSKYHIDAEIMEDDGFIWRFTGIYGDPHTDGKDNTWKLLRTLKHQNNKPWLMAGDFNEILYAWEKEGGVPRPHACLDKFREALEICDLDDPGFVGDAFTWRNNNHDANKYIRERLDRAVATQAWRDRFPGFKVINGDHCHSDHRPIIVDTHGIEKARRGPTIRSRPRFEAKWLEEEDYKEVVKETWESEVHGKNENVAGAIRGVLGGLTDWSKNILGDLDERISKVKKELEMWRRKGICSEQVRRESLLRYKLDRLEEQKNTYWKQWAHVKWMKEGDRNTKYFHSVASERRRVNKIKKLRREDGSVVEEEGAKKEVVTNYFINLFSSNVGTRMDELLSQIDSRVTPEMNELLCKEFSAAEVKEALDNIGDLKAPGMDGMPSIFYKQSWELVGEKVTTEVLNVLNGGPMPQGWNDTCVVLIPKTKSPESMKDLRPISLCNVVYKMVSKVLANRLKQILPEIISPNQSAFFPGRLITDNILLAYECTHYMKNKRNGRDGYAAIKLDMSKAYDRVEWYFLENMMRKLGFDERWIDRIMLGVSTVTYQFRVNGECTDSIVPQRGLR
jgi:hypothetical protein